jgi:DNA-directed RNA polymerase subunit RPC12/RpoP
MPDCCKSDDCKRPLLTGDRIVQMAQGRCFHGYITPTYTDPVIGQWHVDCFREFPLREQTMPYRCRSCGKQIEHNAEIMYVCIGDKPARGYIRPENRGYSLYLVAHIRCPED